jgi:alpha-methylacyl-CoA racemase
VWAFQLVPLARYWATGTPPRPGSDALTGGLPRYNLYETRDGRWLALGALEDRFLARFVELAGLQSAAASPGGLSREVIAKRIQEETADAWLRLLENEDACVSLVRDIGEAIDAATLTGIRAFAGGATPTRPEPPELPLPLDPRLRAERLRPAPDRDLAGASGWPSA